MAPAKKKIKSGYAKDVAPERLSEQEKQGGAVPPATLRGRQLGESTTPTEGGTFESVDAAEAVKRRLLREAGKLPNLKSIKLADRPLANPDGFTPTAGDNGQTGNEAATNDSFEQVEKLKQLLTTLVASGANVQNIKSDTVNLSTFQEIYRISIAIENGGEFGIPVHKILKTKSCITVLLPLTENSVTFKPPLGAHVVITDEESETGYSGYYPGTYCELPELKIAVLMLVNKDG